MPNNGKTSVLSEQQSRVVNLVEQTFWETGGLPTNEYISERLGIRLGTVARYWQDSTFREALIRRGIDLRSETSAGLLTPEQLHVANMMLNMHDKRSQREKLASCQETLGREITSQQYHAWLRQPQFQDYLRRRAEELFKASDHDAYMALIDTVKGGDTKAIQLFFEMRGVYTPRQQLDVNVEMIMVQVVEIVSRRVKDPAIIAEIASDLEALGINTTRRAISSMAPMPSLDL